jgi:sporulation protein YlmC with PRC-barrel domain
MKSIEKELEQDNLTGENHTGRKPNTPVKYLTASTIIGDKLINHLDEHLGKVKDIMLNLADGTIEYLVIESGGFLGMGDKYFAIPFASLSLDTEQHAFVLNQSKEIFEKAPGFDKEHWPKTNAHDFAASSSYWGGFMGPNTGAEPY